MDTVQGMNPMAAQLPQPQGAPMPSPPASPQMAAALQAQGIPCPTCGSPAPQQGCPSCDPTAQLATGPAEQSVDPNSLAGVISQALAQARAAGHAQLDQLQDQAQQQAESQMNPIAAAMLAQPMRGMAGGSMAPMMAPAGQQGAGY